MIAVEGVKQTIAQHGVNKFQIAHFGAIAKVGAVLRHGHGFKTTRHDDIGVTRGDLLHSERNGAQTRSTQLIDAECGFFLRNTGLHGGLTGGVLALSGGKNLAHDHFVNLGGLNIGTGECGGDGSGAKLMRRRIGKRAVECANRSAGSADDNDIFGHKALLVGRQRIQGLGARSEHLSVAL